MDEKRAIISLAFAMLVMGILFASWVDTCEKRIKALEKQLEQKQEAPKPDYEKYRDCCSYYPD